MLDFVVDTGRGDTTLPVNLSVSEAGRLEVTPADILTSSGRQGGPFSPSGKTYTLHNPGANPILWSVSQAGAGGWLSISATDGTLEAGESTIVDVLINFNARGLSPGRYGASVSFTNKTNGEGDTFRLVILTVTPTFQLMVVKSGDGDGTVASQPAGVICGDDCEETYDLGAVITLTATTDARSSFIGWGEACSGIGDCTVTMDSDRTVLAIFEVPTLERAGGLVTLGDGGTVSTGTQDPVEATLIVPPGAVDEDVAITVSVFPADAPFLLPTQTSCSGCSTSAPTGCNSVIR